MEMGSGPSRRRAKTIYLNVEGKDVSVSEECAVPATAVFGGPP